jgi:hypothetical protein
LTRRPLPKGWQGRVVEHLRTIASGPLAFAFRQIVWISLRQAPTHEPQKLRHSIAKNVVVDDFRPDISTVQGGELSIHSPHQRTDLNQEFTPLLDILDLASVIEPTLDRCH